MQGRREGGGCIILSAGDEKRAGEERGVMSSPLGAKRGDRETFAVCAPHPDPRTHYYILPYNQTHTPVDRLQGDTVAGLCQHRMSQTNWRN